MFGLVTRRRYEDDLAAARAEAARLRTQRNTAVRDEETARFNRERILHQLAAADAANRRLAGRNQELGARLSALTESDPDYLTALEKRLHRALSFTGRTLAALWTEQHRADQLQQRLDDACGLNDSRVQDGQYWQRTREDQRHKGVSV